MCIFECILNFLCLYLSILQEFMILPTGAPSFSEALRMGAEVYHNLKVSDLSYKLLQWLMVT